MTSNKSERGTSDSVFLGPPRKKSRLECKFGMKCYRKNPTHFEEFNHCHLNDIIAKWEDENSLPPDVDSELLKISSVVLDQLKIVRECQRKSGMQGGGPISSSSSQGAYVKPHQSEFSAHEEGDIQKINKDPKTVDRQRGSNCTVSKQEQMIREATKHHGDVQAKIDAAAPYNFFLTSVADSPQTHKEHLSITFTELLDKSLGELESSLQINFMVELGWLLAQYFYTGNRFKPMTLLYGVEDEELQEGKKLPSNITAIKVKPPTAFGHHHTKMTVLSYKDKSLRVIISTANLVESDWVNRTQGLWVSPKLPQLPADADTISGESPTCFKGDLLRYLAAYRLPQLQTWLAQIRRTDFSSIRVFLVASVPGTHYGPEVSFWGHRRLKSLLKENIADPKDRRFPWSKWPIIGQFSSIGTLGPDPNSWLCGEWKASVSAPSKPLEDATVKLIYPSLDNVKGSHDGLLGGACLPYQKKIHAKQEWLTAYLHQWQSSVRFRTRAMPHSKSYARVSPCSSFMSWFLLTSANLSKAAWGTETKSKLPGPGLRILSYEAGVLFLPKLLVEDNIFNLSENNNSANIQKAETGKRNEYPPFPIHYDLPLHTYKSGDSPFFYDVFKDD